MIIVNTKNRNMPHPLHNFKLNGKMKYFTNAFLKRGLPLLIGLYIFNIGFVNQSQAQCDVTTITSISKNISSTGNSSTFDFDFLGTQLGLTSCPDYYLWMVYPVNNSGTVSMETAFLGRKINIPSQSNVIVTCSGTLDNNIAIPIIVPSDSMVSFIVSDMPTLGVVGAMESKVDNVQLILNDNQPPIPITMPTMTNPGPIYPSPLKVIIKCNQDTAIYANVVGDDASTAPNDINIKLGPTVEDPCNGIRDTIYIQSVDLTILADTVFTINRKWVFTDNLGNVSDTIRQIVKVIDNQGPVWLDPTEIDTFQMAGNPDRPSDSITFNLNTLNVSLERSDPNYQTALDFWTRDYRPILIDSCIGGIKDTIRNAPHINQLGSNTTTSLGNGNQIIFRTFTGMDRVGNPSPTTFLLTILSIDAEAPKIIDTPFVNATRPFDVTIVDAKNLNDNRDTINVTVFVDKNSCAASFDNDDINIIARDTVSKANITYSWRVDSLDAMSMYQNISMGNDSIAPTSYNAGKYRITYDYEDEANMINGNSSSGEFTIFLNVQTHAPVVSATNGPISTDFDRYFPSSGSGSGIGSGSGSGVGASVKIDTFVLFTIPNALGNNSCQTVVTDSLFNIMAVDTFDNDAVEYRLLVEEINPSNGMPIDTIIRTTTFSPNDSTFSAGASTGATAMVNTMDSLSVGMYNITYTFQDISMCPTPDSIRYVLIVQDTFSGRVNYTNSTFGANDSLTVTIAAADDCEASINWDEPSFLNYSDCSNADTAVSIIRKVVSGPSLEIFDGQPSAQANAGSDIDVDIPVGATVIRYTFTDAFGATDSTDLVVTVLDTIAPVAACPSSIIINRDPMTCMGIAGNYRDFITDNCIPNAALVITQTPAPNDPVMEGDTIRLFLDGVLACSFTAELTDLAPMPVLPLPRDTVINCGLIELPAPRATICGQTDTIFALPRNRGQINISTASLRTYIFDSRETIIVWEFFDSSTPEVRRIVQEITFLPDNISPAAVCYDSITVYPDIFGTVIISPSDLDSLGLSRDNCTEKANLVMSVSLDTISTCDSLGKSFPVYLFVTDETGNKDSCRSIVTVKDTLGPIFQNVPKDTTLDCSATVPGQETLAMIENCGGIDTMYMDTVNTRTVLDSMVTLRPDTMPGYHNYSITYTWTAKDTSGNIGMATQVITVVDTTAPKVDYDSILLVGSQADATLCSADVSLNLRDKVKDACYDTLKYLAIADANGVVIHDTLDVVNITVRMGDTTVYIIAEDFAGNRVTQKLIIRVDDQTDPRPVCVNAVSLSVNAFGYVVVDSMDINLNSSDNCTAVNDLRFELSRDTFRCSDVGSVFEVIMTVIDEADNRHSCSAQITIQDFTGTGSFACPNNVTIACDASIDPDDTGTPTITDVCGDNSNLVYTDKLTAGNGVGNVCQVIERTWTVTDTSGTVTTCVQLISLVDSIAPVLAQTFKDTTVACIDDAMTADSILATDNCVADAYIHAIEKITFGIGNITLQKIWTASDSCRTTADTQLITIVDVIAPVISLPSDTFVYNTGSLIPDSCGVFVTLDFAPFVTDCNAILGLRVGYDGQDSTAILSRYFPVGAHTVMITAKDTSGNITTKNILIDVNDTSTPTIICVENLVISLGTGGTGILQVSNVLSSISDNCGGILSIDTTFLSKTVFNCSDLGLQQVTLTAIDTSGNIGTCVANINVVNQGNNDFISIQTDSLDESITGLNDGQAWVTVTGGSGSHTTLWMPGGATTDTIKNLAPALYTVTVNDTITGCRLTDTVRVNGGNMVTYKIGEIAGMPGTIVQVPVSVTNFTNVTSIDISFNISNLAVAQFVSGNEAGGFTVPGINLTSFNIDPDNSSRLLFGANLDIQTGETVPDGTVVFYINIQLAPNATIGSSTNIVGGGNSEADLKTGLLINNSPVDLVAQSTSGAVSVTNVDNNVTFGGQINLINGNPLANATVVLSGDVSSEDSTGMDGVYTVTIASGQNVTITPTENENARNGLSTFDLVLIQDHINRRLLDSPYKRLAADVNKSGSITVLDIIEIQDVILKRTATFAGVPSWVFVPANHTFADTLNPYNATVPTSITVASAADTAMNFIAIKSGDVSLDAEEIRLRRDVAATDRNKDFTFQVTNQLLKAGTYVEIPFKANNFNEIRGYQMTLDIAKDWLTFESVKAGALANLTKDNFSFTNIAQGQIATNWFNATAQTVADGATLFTLVFKVNKTGNQLSEVLQITSDMIQAEAYAANLFYNGIDLVFEESSATVALFELFQNKPNPFRNETTISFNLPEHAPVMLRFFDFSGRLVHRIKGDFSRGMNHLTVHKNDLSANGVLYYELSTPGFTGRKKMVVIE